MGSTASKFELTVSKVLQLTPACAVRQRRHHIMSRVQSCWLVALGVQVEGQAVLECTSHIFSTWSALNLTEPPLSALEEWATHTTASYAVQRQQQGCRQWDSNSETQAPEIFAFMAALWWW